MIRILTATYMLVASSSALAQQSDFSGVDRFWEIASVLQRDGEPPPEKWDSLFATPGYSALDARERRRDAIVLGIRAALRPSLWQVRDSILGANTWTARVIRHVQALPARKPQLDSLRQQLVKDDFVTRAIATAQTLLPPGTAAKYGAPNIAFLFFLPDGRGYPGLLIADLANIANKTDIVPFFAHEATHFYFGRLAREQPVAPVTPGDSALLRMLTKLFEESVGDQHDKAQVLGMSEAEFASARLDTGWREYMKEYRTQYANAAQELARVDDLLARAGEAGDSVVRAVADSLNRSLPLEGRALGFHITRTIRTHAGDAVLQAMIGDPVAWLEAYGQIRRLNPGTLRLVRRLHGPAR